mmetsp:Transcript_13029/g.24248  ORF Transcript_13029/g.24248 Transcript_13029/m.24248 type:complete len:200 (+) Transcript_13029:1233-1832(+)
MGLDHDTRLRYSRGQYVDCSNLHPRAHCLTHAFYAFLRSFGRCAKTYGSLYTCQTLLFHSKKLLKDPKLTLLRLLKTALRSSIFMSVLCSEGRLVICYFKEVFGRYGPTQQFFAGALTSMSVYIESPDRRMALTKYLLPRALETLWNIWAKNGWVKSLPGGDVILFAFAMGVLMMMYVNDSESLEKSYISSLHWIYGDN